MMPTAHVDQPTTQDMYEAVGRHLAAAFIAYQMDTTFQTAMTRYCQGPINAYWAALGRQGCEDHASTGTFRS